MKKTATKKIVVGIALIAAFCALTAAGAYYYRSEQKKGPLEEPGKNIALSVAFHKEDLENCDVTENVKRIVPYTLQTADTALRELFKGPTEEEKASGLSSTFEPNMALAVVFVEGEIQPLGTYYRGVSIKNKTAVIDFDREALAYLNSPACLQAAVKSPMIQTLLQFPTIKQVEFSIDGEIYTEWDA